MQQLNTFIKTATIPFFVFITGACVLVIEITATRILAPYFGNTIYSVSAVISTVLLALSIGYYVGGKLVDKYPYERLFYGIIAVSGVLVIVLHIVGIYSLAEFSRQYTLLEGPIISSLILFFCQSFLLGTLSPFAVKLQTLRQQDLGIGSVSGKIFFWSTCGSILGSLSAGFFLIPYIGINTIIISIGFLLIFLGGFAMIKLQLWAKALLLAVAILLFCFVVESAAIEKLTVTDLTTLYMRDGIYQRVQIYDGVWGLAPARFLRLDRDASAAMFLEADELTYDYTKYYNIYSVLNPNIKEALVIGGGGYSIPKALLETNPMVHIDVAEIEPTLLPLAKQYFGLPESDRLHNKVEDGRRLLANADKNYDLIFSDAFSSIYSTPSHLTTQEFFAIAKDKLNPNGVFVANVIGGLKQKDASLALSEMKTFKSIFTNSYFFAVRDPKMQGLQNIIFVGYNSPSAVDFTSVAWQAKLKQSSDPIIKNLAKKQVDVSKIDFSHNALLTDDYAPVEYLTALEL